LAYYQILKGGGFTTGSTNFDAKLRRQSIDPQDLLAAQVGGDARGWQSGDGA
jgi:xylose isomerase